MDARNDTVFKRYDKELFDKLYANLVKRQELLSPYASMDKEAVRRRAEKFHVARPNYIKDIERIINCRYFNRYSDKTQVFSLYKNDDISRRALHVQIVSRISRNIGRMLELNQDLIEAIALGHDLGHAPFGHVGERFLSELYYEKTQRYFNHNVHSVRILDKILNLNISFQTLDGILCHNGEKVNGKYRPEELGKGNGSEQFGMFDDTVERCYVEKDAVDHIVPHTMEGCVVRISDIIAYLGKDRQDAAILGIEIEGPFYSNVLLGATNSEFISNIIADIVSNSYGKDYLMLSEEYAEALDFEKNVNFKKIYEPQDKNQPYPEIKIMFRRIYEKMYEDIVRGNEDSPVFRHHINKIFMGFKNSEQMLEEYRNEEPNQIVVDYIASMTDNYFLEAYEYLFPNTIKINYNSYFPNV